MQVSFLLLKLAALVRRSTDDILAVGTFPTPLSVRLDDGRTISLRDMVLTLEVKELSGSRIRSTGTTLLGEYEDGWRDLTKQSDAQKIALGKTLRRRCAIKVRVENLIWLVNHKGTIPDRMPFVLKGDFDGVQFFKAVVRLRELRGMDNTVSFKQTEGAAQRLQDLQRVDRFFTATIRETKADRKRLRKRLFRYELHEHIVRELPSSAHSEGIGSCTIL